MLTIFSRFIIRRHCHWFRLEAFEGIAQRCQRRYENRQMPRYRRRCLVSADHRCSPSTTYHATLLLIDEATGAAERFVFEMAI
jgi:hypothetical protein